MAKAEGSRAMSCSTGSPVVWGAFLSLEPPREAGGRGGGGTWPGVESRREWGRLARGPVGAAAAGKRGLALRGDGRPLHHSDTQRVETSPRGGQRGLVVVTVWGTHSQLSGTPDPCQQLWLKFALKAMKQFPQPICIHDGGTGGQRVVLHTLKTSGPTGVLIGPGSPVEPGTIQGHPPALPARPTGAHSLARPLGGPECQSHPARH